MSGAEHALDARGLLCPLPVIRTQDRIRRLEPGDVLVVTASDPGVMHDIPAWCRVHGHELLEARRCGEEFRFRVRVRDAGPTRRRPRPAPAAAPAGRPPPR